MARDIQLVLRYASWENFENTIHKAQVACESSATTPDNHFHETMKKVEAGSGAMVPKKGYFLTRYACYLIAMNGDTSKPEIVNQEYKI